MILKDNQDNNKMQYIIYEEEVVGSIEIIDKINSDIKILNNKVDRIENKLDKVYDQTVELTEYKSVSYENFNKINDSIDFIKSKINKSEEDIFTIKNKMPIK
ncbi:MAG: hypothetical protein RR912_01555 [Clostridium sp.]